MTQTDDATVESAGAQSTRPHISAAKRNSAPIQIARLCRMSVATPPVSPPRKKERVTKANTVACRFDFGLPVPESDWTTAPPNCRRLPVGMVEAYVHASTCEKKQLLT